MIKTFVEGVKANKGKIGKKILFGGLAVLTLGGVAYVLTNKNDNEIQMLPESEDTTEEFVKDSENIEESSEE